VNCNYKKAATLHIVETWFVLGTICKYPVKKNGGGGGDDDDDDDTY
jgi:hypothetical protein